MQKQESSAKVGFDWDENVPTSCDYISPHIRRLCRQYGIKSALDLGCGNGVLASELSQDGLDVVGCDPDETGITAARKAFPDLEFHTLGVYDDPETIFSGRTFDAVISTEVVEHLFKPSALPQFAAKVLPDGGKLIITCPYHGYIKNLIIAVLGKWDFQHTTLWEGGHIKFWSFRTMTQLLNNNGFDVLHLSGAGRLPYIWKSMLVVAEKRPA